MKGKVFCFIAALCFLVFLSAFPALAQWQASIGAESPNMGHQALAFLPNEVWIHAGDSITWTVESHEIHTVTFLVTGQVRQPFPVGCPGFSASPATFDGSTCISAAPLAEGTPLTTFTVMFPKAGNYKLVCLVHPDMTGTIHVLAAGTLLPHDQAFYDAEAAQQATQLLSDADMGQAESQATPTSMSDPLVSDPPARVTVGIGEVTGNAGGKRTLSIVRFFHGAITIHAGQTVEWTNHDPSIPHTITFGAEPANDQPPSLNVFVDADGARHAIIASPADNVHSGFIVAAPQERTGLPQAPLGVTRFRVTFMNPGTYPYRCVLHDNLGMTGTVVVLP